VTFAAVVRRIRDALLLGRRASPARHRDASAAAAAAITGEDPGLVAPLMGCWTADRAAARRPRPRRLFGVRLHRFAAAVDGTRWRVEAGRTAGRSVACRAE